MRARRGSGQGRRGVDRLAERLRHFAEESRAVCTAGESCLKGWFLSEEWELVPGTWTLEAWLGDRLVATQSFELYRD